MTMEPSAKSKSNVATAEQSAEVKDSRDNSADQAIPGLSDLYWPGQADASPEQSKSSDKKAKTVGSAAHDIVDVLLEMSTITAEQHTDLRKKIADASAKAKGKGKGKDNIESLLLKSKLVSDEDILMAKARFYGMEVRHIDPKKIDMQAFKLLNVDPNSPENSNIIPIAVEGETLVIATSEPENVFAIEDVKRQSPIDIQVVVCLQQEITASYESLKEMKLEGCLDDIISDMAEVELVEAKQDDDEDLEKMAGESPVIKFVNYLISNAIKEGASDIHIEPKTEYSKVRYRIDGVLFEMMQSPIKMHPAIISRIKIMSNLDIAERRLPQDDKIVVMVGGRGIDLRVSILPTSHGEKVVIRVLDSKSISIGLELLGMEPKVLTLFNEQIAMPHGIMLVTGPTGSGKSTTLYSAMSQMDGDKLNISTVEDPVEYELAFCNQVQANERIGLDFASALRSLLRQDPDIIMIGEIRDNETARIAVQAALTGHLVLSTLHTNDAASSITRLVNIGIDPYLIAASLNGVLAQRLVRKICPKCKKTYKPPENMLKYMKKAGIDATKKLYQGAGCDNCRGSGYEGRVGIYELLVIDEQFRDMINNDSSVSNMRQAFHESKADSLFDDGMQKVKQGLTTIGEVLRVTEIYGQSEDKICVENIK